MADRQASSPGRRQIPGDPPVNRNLLQKWFAFVDSFGREDAKHAKESHPLHFASRASSRFSFFEVFSSPNEVRTMKRIETEILVIGGGATGTGIAWDAALRGFKVVLIEKRDLTHGTTGRYHGLLHSGGRYVVKDPVSATECIHENRILRKTHAHCIENTGGFFVVTPEDEGPYPDQFVAGCRATGVDCAEISLAEALRREPLLNPAISRVFEVPDGSADSFLATHATAQAARHAGAQILIYHELTNLLIEGGDGNRRVVGAQVRDMAKGLDVRDPRAMTINASGAWAGKVAALAGVAVKVIPGKGVMVAMNHRVVNTVLNRCKMPDDGDIIVPIHTVAVIGTTDEKVTEPEPLRIEPWEVQLMLDEGEKLVPGLSRARVVRAWAGVRPLYQEGLRRREPRCHAQAYLARSPAARPVAVSSPSPAASGPPSA
jgi:glycerol-3-phosphate dehydrogenase